MNPWQTRDNNPRVFRCMMDGSGNVVCVTEIWRWQEVTDLWGYGDRTRYIAYLPMHGPVVLTNDAARYELMTERDREIHYPKRTRHDSDYQAGPRKDIGLPVDLISAQQALESGEVSGLPRGRHSDPRW